MNLEDLAGAILQYGGHRQKDDRKTIYFVNDYMSRILCLLEPSEAEALERTTAETEWTIDEHPQKSCINRETMKKKAQSDEMHKAMRA